MGLDLTIYPAIEDAGGNHYIIPDRVPLKLNHHEEFFRLLQRHPDLKPFKSAAIDFTFEAAYGKPLNVIQARLLHEEAQIVQAAWDDECVPIYDPLEFLDWGELQVQARFEDRTIYAVLYWW
jgi:hypothetical protein